MFSIFDKENLALARRAATEGIVLLKNENEALPLSKDKTVALFGRNQFDVFKGGGGAADVWAVPVYPFADALNEVGKIYQPLLKKYKAYSEANYNRALNKVHYQYVWYLPDVNIKEEDVAAAAKECDTAVIFIGRYASENFDVNDKGGEYRLTGTEEAMIEKASRLFKKTVLVLNLPGLFDMLFLRKYKIDAIVQTFMPGMQAGPALADVLYGDVTPSGKLPDSWAERLYEYPTTEGFDEDDILYNEGVYMGYRYFDTFKKDVLFPFGFGLSYTTFDIKTVSAKLCGTKVILEAEVTNTGKYAGKEIVQCYLSAPDGQLEKPYQTLCGFEKTRCLKPDESQILQITVELLDFTSYSEAKAAYLLEGGSYVIRVGNHSRNTVAACEILLSETVICRKVKNRIVPQKAMYDWKKPESEKEDIVCDIKLVLDPASIVTEIIPDFAAPEELLPTTKCSFTDVVNGKNTPEEFVAQLTDDELALFLTADSPHKLRGFGLEIRELASGEGTHTHYDERLGIPASVMQDGPAGVRASGFHNPVPPDDEINGKDCIAYPSATMLAASWNRELNREIGFAFTKDLSRCNYNGLCAPGVNLHRNPRCGRNFEYFSEDPYLAAEMAAHQILGIQNNPDGTPTGKYAVLKHFACNNAENHRLDGSSVLSERCARELYLRVFEYVIKKSNPLSIMTAYNKVNGIFAAANSELIDGICRTEWKYDGWIMTDWSVHTPAYNCIKGGSDTVMPGAYVTAEDYAANGVDRATAQKRVASLIKHLARTENHTPWVKIK